MSLGNLCLVEFCAKFGYTCQWEDKRGKTTGETTFELDSPRMKNPVGKLAEVKAECFFFANYYLLVGKRSGDEHKIKGKKFWESNE